MRNTKSKNYSLLNRRISLGLTQLEVAQRANIPLQSYQAFEYGRREIMSASFLIACRVIEALDMNVSDYLHYYVLEQESAPKNLRSLMNRQITK